jgi:ketosteroid isomerase-like protein
MGAQPPEPGSVVRSFFERMQARDWDGAAALVAPDATVRFTETGERFVGDAFVAMNRAYPEGWAIDVVEVLSAGDRVAAQVRVDHRSDGDVAVFWCAGFYTVRDGRIVDGVEHWVTEGGAASPGWRAPFVTP